MGKSSVRLCRRRAEAWYQPLSFNSLIIMLTLWCQVVKIWLKQVWKRKSVQFTRLLCSFFSFAASKALAGFSQRPSGTNVVPVISGIRKRTYLQSPFKVLAVVADSVLSLWWAPCGCFDWKTVDVCCRAWRLWALYMLCMWDQFSFFCRHTHEKNNKIKMKIFALSIQHKFKSKPKYTTEKFTSQKCPKTSGNFQVRYCHYKTNETWSCLVFPCFLCILRRPARTLHVPAGGFMPLHWSTVGR